MLILVQIKRELDAIFKFSIRGVDGRNYIKIKWFLEEGISEGLEGF